MYLDQKVTIWQRVHFNNEQDMQKAIKGSNFMTPYL
mgnify:CR=1 FL=1